MNPEIFALDDDLPGFIDAVNTGKVNLLGYHFRFPYLFRMDKVDFVRFIWDKLDWSIEQVPFDYLAMAIANGEGIKVLEFLIDTRGLGKKMYNYRTEYLLHKAAEHNRLDVVQLLWSRTALKRKHLIDYKHHNGLLMARAKGYVDVANYLEEQIFRTGKEHPLNQISTSRKK